MPKHGPGIVGAVSHNKKACRMPGGPFLIPA
jgi:hypothetical protein